MSPLSIVQIHFFSKVFLNTLDDNESKKPNYFYHLNTLGKANVLPLSIALLL